MANEEAAATRQGRNGGRVYGSDGSGGHEKVQRREFLGRLDMGQGRKRSQAVCPRK